MKPSHRCNHADPDSWVMRNGSLVCPQCRITYWKWVREEDNSLRRLVKGIAEAIERSEGEA